MQASDFSNLILWPKPGSYIVAVSGGVDSVVLLDVFAREVESRGYRLTVAHFDHGMRADSAGDAEFVSGLANQYQLPYESGRGALAGRSEADARIARYAFLDEVKIKHHAHAIITAHHADDEMETVIFNTLRGSNIFGQTGFSEQGNILRPLKAISKAEIKAYAENNQLHWREDSSNTDNKYARNFVRNQFLPAVRKHDPNFDAEFSNLQKKVMQSGSKLQLLIAAILDDEVTAEWDKATIEREVIAAFSEEARCYLLQAMAKKVDENAEIASKTIHEAARFVVAAKNGQGIDLASGLRLVVRRDKVCFTRINPESASIHTAKPLSA